MLYKKEYIENNKKLKKENERLKGIIKEVRKMAEEKSKEEIGGWSWKILEILDK